MRRTRILLTDDQCVLIDLLAKLLQPHFDVVGTMSDGLALLSTAQQLKPDVIEIDIGMPKLDGFNVGRQFEGLLPETKMLAMSMNEDPEIAAQAV
jgi:DNA-binding NarL/FixJ family response regulator